MKLRRKQKQKESKAKNNNQVDVAREESTDKNQNQRISTEVEDVNPYEQNYAFLKQVDSKSVSIY